MTFSEEKLECDYIICVYDYEQLSQANRINQAIIFHELGHIYYPPESIQQEILCDLYATKQVDFQSVCDYLKLSIREMKKIDKSINDLETRETIIKSLL